MLNKAGAGFLTAKLYTTYASGHTAPKQAKSKKTKIPNNLLSEATIATTIEVVVEELWTRTVPNIPIIKPAIGLERILFEAKASPAALPPRSRKALLRKSKEQINMYRRPMRSVIFAMLLQTLATLPHVSKSEKSRQLNSQNARQKKKKFEKSGEKKNPKSD